MEARVLWRITRYLLGTLFAGTCALLVTRAAHAATVVVTNTLDSGPGSLRQTVLDATGGDNVIFDSAMFSVPLTVTLTNGQIEISKSLSIDGTRGAVVTPTISGNYISRVFQVDEGTNVTLDRLYIVQGFISGGGGGGLSNRGTLTIYNSSFTDNTSSATLVCNTAGCIHPGGGSIDNRGTLTIIGSTFIRNKANGFVGCAPTLCNGGAIYNAGVAFVAGSMFSANGWHCSGAGGGIVNIQTGVLTVTGSTFAYNCAASGGGIANAGVMYIESTQLTGNSAPLGGGGLWNGGTLAVVAATFAENASERGGGIMNMGGAMRVTNGTFVSNTAVFTGGGIAMGISGMLDMANSTIVANSAPDGGGLDTVVSATLVNTILTGGPAGRGDSCAVHGNGAIIDGGHNLDDSNTCGFTTLGSLTNTNPLLGSLGWYGGPVPTLPLLPGSPAIDAGDDAACPAMDARGIHRPQGPHCDIGAYEAFSRHWWLPVILR